MRQMEVLVPTDQREAAERVFEEMGVKHVIVEAVERDGVVFHVPVPTGAVEVVFERLEEAGLDPGAHTVVTSAETIVGANVDGLTEEYVEGPQGQFGVSHSELRARAQDLWPNRPTYVVLSALSAIVAAAGLLLDSSIVIVGAMVIAPFAGSTLSGAVGIVIRDRKMVADSVGSQALGLSVAILTSTVVSVGLARLGFVPRSLQVSQLEQVAFFLTPSLLALAIAVCAGAAGALALATDLPVAIAGVAVAAAIVPSAATVGLGVVWGDALMSVGALVLLLMNIVFINVTAYATLLALGYHSSVVSGAWGDLGFDLRSAAYVVAVTSFVVIGVVTAGATYQHITYEHAVANEVAGTVDEGQYRQLQLLGISTQYNDVGLFERPETVTVTFGRTSEREYTNLAATIQRRILERTNQSVEVRVRFIDYEVAPPNERRSGRGRAPRLAGRPPLTVSVR
ncbi:DUF389 domain-containing protein [Halomarina pelagica]|uniref:DUF389 domain-containing protein n=1 Tax=Halomarina pelagica TaxID=2961599 RepID=UPI0020C52EBD|nr:DUF389 domain-containing protein [Halomarina sp. BND7]